jgi:signal transduction histidine kinase
MRLHSRIYLHSLIVLIIACFTTATVFALSARGMFMHGIPERAARHFASLVAEHFDDPVLLQRQLDRFHAALEIDVTVRDLTGRIVAGSGRELPPLNAEEADGVLRGGVTVRARPVWQVAVSVQDPASGAVVGILRASMQRLAAPALARPILGVMFVLLVVAVITLPTARRIARPLRRLTEAATRLGSGDLSVRVPVAQAGHGRSWWRGGRRDELQELTSSFNEMADRVERLVRSQRVLLANVSHELRSPLTRIRMAMDLLPADIRDGAKLRGVESDLSDLDRLIEDVLTTARLDETGLPTRLDTFDARRVLTDVVARAQHDPIVDGRAIQVAPGPPVTLCADEALLRRAVWNLVENAAKYGAPPITLAVRSEGERVAFTVADDGAGIPATDRERVFAPFYRGERARAPGGHRGVGLGLTLARRIADVHGGTIAVAAASGAGEDERGCQVVITLPARPPA